MADIDMDGKSFNIIGDLNTNAFKGTFDGNYYKISNLNIESNAQYVGMFGYTSRATIKNLTIENINITGTASSGNQYIGGLVGYSSYTAIDGIAIKGSTIKENGTPTTEYIGGLAGYAYAGQYVVGSYGYNMNVTSSYATNVDITGGTGNSYLGGLIGYMQQSKYGILDKAYSTGNITIGSGQTYAGGLIGYISNTSSNKSSWNELTNAYSTVNIKGENNNTNTYVGGLIGYAYSWSRNDTIKISNTYSVGKIVVNIKVHKGGLIGYSNSYVSDSYYSADLTGLTESNGGIYKLTQNMLNKEMYTNWDFDSRWEMEESLPYLKDMEKPNEILKENLQYPIYEGNGTEEDPYIIDNIKELQYIEVLGNKAYSKLKCDIDASGLEDFSSIGNFTGLLDGNNHKISNLTIKSGRGDKIGLFAENKGTIQNLKLDNVNIKGTNTYVGGIAGYNSGNIFNVEVNGNIENIADTISTLYIGQIAGYNNNYIGRGHSNGTIQCIGNAVNVYTGGIVGENNGIIKLSYNTGKISINNIDSVIEGGIAGITKNLINNSYSNGTIQIDSKTATIGGIAGENTGKIRNTYSIDNINKTATNLVSGGIAGKNSKEIINSYWNIDGIEDQEGKGTYQTLEKLKKQSTYENWNFERTWYIEENSNTPKIREDLSWYEDEFWEWHTRTTTTDQAYNGNHIEITEEDSIKFYGYGVTSYKDFLYKDYSYAGEKTFEFVLDETKANYHTLDGAGFIFNAKSEDNKLSGYILLIKENDICLYRIDDVDITEFETKANTTIETYAGNPIVSVPKSSSTLHKLTVKTSPTNVTIIDNDEEILNKDLDYSNHVGESFGLISAYLEHNCKILTEIEFTDFNLEIDNYTIPVSKIDEAGNPLQGANFQVKNEAGDVVREGITNEKGIFSIEGLQEGIYTLEETKAPYKYAFKQNKITFKVTDKGKAVDVDTGEEIKLNIENELLKIQLQKYEQETTIPVAGAVIGLFDEDEKPILDESGNQIKATSDENGKVVFKNIEAKKYKYKELEAPSGYKISEEVYNCELNKDGTVTFENNTEGIIYNEKLKVEHVVITKHRRYTTTPVSGAVIGLFDENGEALLDSEGNQIKLTTDENGQVDFRDLEVGKTYQYKELQAPEGYILNNTMFKFIISNTGMIIWEEKQDKDWPKPEYSGNDGIIYNDRVMSTEGATKIRKYKTGTTIGLPGAIIGIFDNSGNPILDSEGHQIQLTTNENGEVSIPALEYGTYKYKELQAPEGYVLNDTMYTFKVNGEGAIVFIENEDGRGKDGIIYNDRVKAEHVFITKYKAGTDIPIAGAVIGLYDNEGNAIIDPDTDEQIKLTTNEDGEIDFTNLEVGTYQYKEIEAPAGYVLNTSMYKFTVDNNGDVTFENDTNGVIYNDRVKAEHVYITKYKTGTTLPIAGAVIGLYDENGTAILGTNGEQVKLTTGENGKIDFAGLEPGIYQYKEIEAPAGYVLNTSMYKFIVNEDTTITYIDGENGNGTNGVIYNDRVKADHVYITKYKARTTEPLSGAVIGLFDNEGNAILDPNTDEQIKLTTNEEGKIDFTNLEVGMYKYKELEAPAGYILNDTMYKFTVNDNGSVTFENDTDGVIYNDTVTSGEGTAKIRKYKTGTTVPVSGAIIGLFDNEGNALLDSEGKEIELTTDENGEISIPSLGVGTYLYKEIQAPEGYILNDTMYKFIVENDGTITFIENEITNGDKGTGKDGIIYNDRVKAEHTIITKYRTGTTNPVSGAVIGLFNDEGNAILGEDGEQVKLSTNEQGQIDFTNLEPGIYKYQELQAPAGYVLDNTIYKFKVNNDGTVTFIENEDSEGSNRTGKDGIIYNDRIKAESAVIVKYETGTTKPVSGAIIGLFDSDGNPILGEDNQQIKLTTGENGQIDFTNLEVGTYKYQELQAPEGYILNNAVCEFKVNEDGTVTFIEGENGLGRNGIIYNDRITAGQIIITKYKTGTTKPVPGAVIGLFDNEGKEILGLNGEQVKLITGTNGQIEFKNLKPGTYQYKEIEAPVGYVLNNTMYKFKVNNDGTVTFIENESTDGTGGNGKDGIIYNNRVKAEHVTITKYETGTTNPVSGAIIGLFSENGNPILGEDGEQIRLTTDENGRVDFANLEVGTYQYKELQAPEGYVLNNTMYKFIINNDGTITFTEDENGTSGIIYNDRVTSDVIVIMKYRTGTQIPVAGAIIGLFNESGEAILNNEGNQIKLTTNEEGKIAFTLRPGIYQYKELQAPEGYIINDTMYKFIVGNDGKVTFESGNIIYNDKIKTGSAAIIKFETGTTTPINGAVIGLFDKDGNPIKDNEGNQIKQTTNNNGQVIFKDLPAGEYQYKELQAPKGYKLNNEMYAFIVDTEGQITFKDNTQGIIYNSKEDKNPGGNTTPEDNTTPPDNTTPDDNTTPENNTTPSDNITPSNNTSPSNNVTSGDNITQKNETNSSTNTRKNKVTSNKKNSIAESIKQGILPKTGAGRLVLVIIVLLTSSAGYYAIKYKKINRTKK